VREEGEQLRDIYHRIIRKVKRQSVNAHSLDEIYEQVNELLSLRCSIKQEEAKLVVMEREFELGRFSPLSHQTSTELIATLNDSAKHIKKCIEANIHALQ
jgi:hypothetical protein